MIESLKAGLDLFASALAIIKQAHEVLPDSREKTVSAPPQIMLINPNGGGWICSACGRKY